MELEGYTEQKGTPTPDNPVDIETGIVVIVDGKKVVMDFDEFVLKEGDKLEKIDGKWYLVRGNTQDMGLKKAKEILVAFKLANIVEIITQEEFEDVKKAIDTVLKELNNRIPRKDIEDKIEELNEGIKQNMKDYDKIENKDWKLAIHRTMQQKIEIRKTLNKLLNKE